MQIKIIQNNQGAFSLPFSSQLAMILAICGLVLVGLLHFIVKSHLQRKGLIIIIAGGLSNLIDRVVRGGVLDIFHSNSMSWNIADIMILLGAIFILFNIISTWTHSGRRVLQS